MGRGIAIYSGYDRGSKINESKKKDTSSSIKIKRIPPNEVYEEIEEEEEISEEE
jgi:hypothetical protein